MPRRSSSCSPTPAIGILGKVVLGPVTGVERNNQTKFLLRTVKGTVPKGTRAAAVAIQFDRVDGAYDDGYADSLSLVLTGV